MKRISFMKHGMELYTAHVKGSHNHGDALPVPLVKAGLQDWKMRMGWDDDAHVSAGKSWDQVRVGASVFTADQYQRAEKSFDGTTPVSALETVVKAPATPPKIFTAPKDDEIPDWGFADAPTTSTTASQVRNSFDTVRHETALSPHTKMTPEGEIDMKATEEAHLQAELLKRGFKPRPPKP